MASVSYSKRQWVGLETVRSNSRLPLARCRASASLSLLAARFHFVRSENICSRLCSRRCPSVCALSQFTARHLQHLTVGIHQAHFAQVQLLHAGFNLRAIAHHHPNHVVRMYDHLRRVIQVAGLQRAYFACKCLVVIVRQTKVDQVGDRLPDLGNGFPRTRQAQCLSSRRFILSRPAKVPPSPSFMASMAISFGLFVGGAMCPAIIIDCNAPGLSTRYTTDFAACCTVPIFFAGTFPVFHPANNFSSFGVISASVVSPTTISVESLGRIQPS